MQRLTRILLLAALAAAAAVVSAGAPSAGTDRPQAVPDDPAAPPSDSLARLVERAREAAAGERHDDAADRYREAAALAPDLGRWLRLSALQHRALAGDTAAARTAAERLRDDRVVSLDSVRLERARAAFEAGDPQEGLRAAAGLDGDEDPELWVTHAGPAYLAAGDTARARSGYRAAATAPEAPAEAGRVLLELGTGWDGLAAVARADLAEDRAERGRDLLARALDAAPREEASGLALRLVEARLEAGLEQRAHGTAAEWLARDDLSAETRARMELLAARSHLRRGERRAREVHLRRAIEAGDGERSARAAYLLADGAHARGARAEARRRYEAAAVRFPETRLGGQARMRLGLMELADGRPDRAVEHFRSYRLRQPRGPWGHAALYWEGRARRAAADSARAEELLRRAARRDPVSYYARLAGRRLGTDPLEDLVRTGRVADRDTAAGGDDAAGRETTADRQATADGAGGGTEESRTAGTADGGGRGTADRRLLRRMNALRALEWRDRAERELEVGRGEALRAAGGPLAFARRLHGAGWPERGIGMGWSAFDRAGGAWSRPLLEVIYPLPHREALAAAAAREGLSPALVAAVIRQESVFDPRAVSSAGAVGLMQLMPGTAAELAGGRVPPDEEALTDPELSLELGARYLSAMLDRFDGSRIGALVAYNAGPDRYRRWRRFPEFVGDPELAVERIPYGETRRYVKAVLRNEHVYRRLYDLPAADVRRAE